MESFLVERQIQINNMIKICLRHYYSFNSPLGDLSMIEQCDFLVGQFNDILPEYMLPLEIEDMLVECILQNADKNCLINSGEEEENHHSNDNEPTTQ